MKTYKPVFLSFLFVSGFFFHAFSQKQILAGLNVNADLYSSTIRPSAGFTLEAHLTKHSGLETGLFYRASKSHGIVIYTDSLNFNTYPFVVSQKFLNIPVLYKYYSKIINFSVGPTLDVFVGWKQKGDDSQVHVNNFNINPKVKIGLLGKVSKTFVLDKRLIIEPEFRFGFLRTSNDAGVGLGVAGKYRL